MRRTVLSLLVGATALATTLVFEPPASAHEARTVHGYHWLVGFGSEPTYAGFENFVQLFLEDPGGKPVLNIGKELHLTVQTGSASKAFSLVPSFDPDSGMGTRGEFDAFFIPTAPGPYTFHFTGTLGGKVDQSFTSGPQTFDTAHDPSDIQFPAQVPTALELSQKLDREIPRLTTAIALAGSDASGRATTALIVGIVGVLLGLAGLGFGVAANRQRA